MKDCKKNTHGGKREGAGRKPGIPKINKTFSIDVEVADKKPTSKLVNELLKDYYRSKQNMTVHHKTNTH